MTRTITTPPADGRRPDGTLLGGWWHDDPEHGRIVCDLCPRECHLKPGDRGFCFVRENVDGQMVLSTYGRSTGFCIDPIEKKPLNHFYPGTSVLSFGTAGCNLGCKFCQNWDISKSREVERLSEVATPRAIAEAAQRSGCRSVAFTYNDPIIWAEYAIDTAVACRELGIKTVAVTAGYISPAARAPFFSTMDAANVDLKGFTEDFYYKITYSHLQPVLDTLEWLHRETDVWFEITNLVIPRTNDSPDEIRRMCEWILQHCGDEVPVHFTAFHPDFRMRDLPNTPHETLLQAYELGRQAGLKYVYTGNVDDVRHQSTYCPGCGKRVIERNWYELGEYRLSGDVCQGCGGRVAGRFDSKPGDWGRKRVPVRIQPSPRDAAPGGAPGAGAPGIGANRGPGGSSQVVQLLPASAAPSLLSSASNSSESSAMNRPAAASTGVAVRPVLTDAQQIAIRHAANEFIAADVCGRQPRLPDATLAGAASIPVMGAFVTLKRQGRLRACCGFLGQPMTLFDALRQAARRTALEDHRFPPISPTELPAFDLDVSLLYHFVPLRARGAERLREVEVGRHGLQIRRGASAGLLLPSVPVENGWDAETFLLQVCRKANLPTTAWSDDATELTTFESFAIGGPFLTETLDTRRIVSRPFLDAHQVERFAQHCHSNLVSLIEGGTPNYYLFDVPDGTVAGVAIVVRAPGVPEPLQLGQLSLRPGVPLQATISQLCDAAARSLRNLGVRNSQLGALSVGVAVLSDSAMHGTLVEPDLRGLDPTCRALLLFEAGRSVWVYDPQATGKQLLERATRELKVIDPRAASLLSMAIASSEPTLLLNTAPRPASGRSVRPAAVAGTFYSDDAAELGRLVDSHLAAVPRRAEPWPAVMVPHAGLKYSGALAAATFQRVEIPELVIVIGPKHTRLGVPWAVAPHAEWALPGGNVPSDPEVARKLAAAIPGLELDAAAHQQEHAIEVELPYLAKLAPGSRVVGIAIGGGDYARIEQFASGLADVVRGLPTRPLLVISSDMNHFASDEENRRLDELALQAMESLDPRRLLEVCTTNDISMCGVLPAVIVMEALRRLGGLNRVERVGYSTSADVTRDTSRVVGYAGMLLG